VINYFKRNGQPDFDLIFGVRKIRAQDWHPEPTRKNTDEVATPDLSDVDVGYGDDDRDDDETDEGDEGRRKGTTTMKTLVGLAKRYGWQAVAKQFAENGTGSFSEAEVTAFLTAVAQKAFPGESSDVAFSKAFSAPTADGELMRRTTMAARDAQFLSKVGGSTPHFLAAPDDGPKGTPGRASLRPRVSGFSGGGRAQNVDDPKTALAQLQELVDAQRAQHPELSEAGAFARVYLDPANKDLAARERAENRPTAAW
jgi:hypothetical protein